MLQLEVSDLEGEYKFDAVVKLKKALYIRWDATSLSSSQVTGSCSSIEYYNGWQNLTPESRKWDQWMKSKQHSEKDLNAP